MVKVPITASISTELKMATRDYCEKKKMTESDLVSYLLTKEILEPENNPAAVVNDDVMKYLKAIYSLTDQMNKQLQKPMTIDLSKYQERMETLFNEEKTLIVENTKQGKTFSEELVKHRKELIAALNEIWDGLSQKSAISSTTPPKKEKERRDYWSYVTAGNVAGAILILTILITGVITAFDGTFADEPKRTGAIENIDEHVAEIYKDMEQKGQLNMDKKQNQKESKKTKTNKPGIE